ncbi:antibiotic biosynthesis monooxygenase family protein [Patulibacter sp. NPDC049589]|uniref:putative quinol monooxygenase n=1 Tax=Patulibacter sp. NPDC049589 TaxID=3154731 RepID=UPI0034139F51
MSVTAILDLHFKPEAVEQALEILTRALADTRAFDGCEGVTVVQDRDDPAHVVAVEQWASLEADARYREWRAGDGAITDLPPTLAGAPSLFVGTDIAAL